MGKGNRDLELKSALSTEFSDASVFSGYIGDERSKNLKYYNMNPVNLDSPEGRSRAKTSDVADVVDWIMPQLQKLLNSQDPPVEFMASSADDVEAAKQETAYIKHILDKNSFFITSVVWYKDALIQKNGVIKVFWEKETKKQRETYKNLSPLQLQALEADDDIEIFEKEYVVEINPTTGMEEQFCNVVAFKNKDASGVKIINIAPENFYIRRGWNSICLDDVPYCAHREKVSKSQLVMEGFSRDEIEELGGGNISALTVSEAAERLFKESYDEQDLSNHAAEKSIWVTEHFIRYDYNDDGVDELLKVRTVGEGSGLKIIDRFEIDSNPFIPITPEIMPHTFWGRALADNVREIQDIKTVLLRQALNNLYLTNEPRPVVRRGSVDLDSLYDSDIGAPIFVSDMNAIRYDAVPFVANAVLPVFEYLDLMREERTGVSKQTQGLDPNAMKDQTSIPAMRLMTAAQERILMIARVFAEVGYRQLFLKIHELVLKNEKSEQIFELTGNYVTVNPREWTERTSMRIKVGTGNLTKDERLAAISQILGYQEKIIAAQGSSVGMVNLRNVHAALMEFCDLAGIKNGELYFTAPDKIEIPPPQPPVPDSATEVAFADIQSRSQIENKKIELEAQKTSDELMLKRQIESQKLELESQKLLLEKQTKERELEIKTELEAMKIQLQVMSMEDNKASKQKEEESDDNEKEKEGESEAIKMLLDKIASLEEKITSRKQYNFQYDKQGKIVKAESEVNI